MTRLTIATRRSALALAQARAWIRTLEAARPDLEIVELHVTTSGDRIQDRALREVGGKGLFIKEIEEALVSGRADLAVHSMKDVPAELSPGLVIGCVPPREDPRDVVVARSGASLRELPAQSRVGTSSLRRTALLRAWRADLAIVPLRGNVDTRLAKCERGEVDAIVLARAGLLRLGLSERATEVLDPEICLPAIGQGALAIEHRTDDARVAAIVGPLADESTSLAVAAERGIGEVVEGSCDVPVAGYAVRDGDDMWLRGMLARPDGSRPVHDELRATWPRDVAKARALGVQLGRRLLGGS